MKHQPKIIIITAPSGSGKTTLVKLLLAALPHLTFSVSCCTRTPRVGEIDGLDYYFISEKEFQNQIEKNEFVEWEMVYKGKYYGTLKKELGRIWEENKTPLIDIDVQGALAVKKQYPAQSLSIFIQAPSIQELEKRLIFRNTENEKTLKERIDKAAEELLLASQFDETIINDNLEKAFHELKTLITNFLAQ